MTKVLEVMVEVSEQKFNWDRVLDVHNFHGNKDSMIMYLFDKYTYQQFEMTFHRTLNLLMTDFMFTGQVNGNSCMFCELLNDNTLRLLYPKETRKNYKVPYLDIIGLNYKVTSERMISLQL